LGVFKPFLPFACGLGGSSRKSSLGVWLGVFFSIFHSSFASPRNPCFFESLPNFLWLGVYFMPTKPTNAEIIGFGKNSIFLGEARLGGVEYAFH